MSHLTTQAPRPRQLIKGSDRRMFAASDDNAMIKQVQATHSPDGREVQVRPILHLVEEVLRHGAANIEGVITGTTGHVDSLMDDKTSMLAYDGMLDALAYVVQKISCEMACKCTGGGDAHTTTISLFNTLSSYSWEAKVVLTLAAFAALYGEFLLVTQLYATNSLAKSVALLKQLPDILENSVILKPQFDALNKLIKAAIDVTVCIIEFTELPSQYISIDTPAMASAMVLIPTAAYWTIRSLVACASKIMSLITMSHEHFVSTTETWELSSLNHKVRTIHDHLLKQIKDCHHVIDEKKQIEAYDNLVRLFETLHLENLRNLNALMPSKDNQPPLFDGSANKRVSVEVLRKKLVLLLISDLDLTYEEISVLRRYYNHSKQISELHYEAVWLPIVDNSVPWDEEKEDTFKKLRAEMPWFSINHPSMIEPAVTRYIKDVWHFTKKPIVVTIDWQGRVNSKNAINMIWIWGNQAFPFTDEREESLWRTESWTLELLVDDIDLELLKWNDGEQIVCLYGSEDANWIRSFTSQTKAVASAAKINIEMVYAGKHNARERVKRITDIIKAEELSRYWENHTSIWFFWTRLESMLYSKMRHGRKSEQDQIMHEVMTILSFDGSEQGWALFYRNPNEIARAKGETALKSMLEYEAWAEAIPEYGFVPALNAYLQELHTPHHCNRLILPGINGDIPERVVCAECGKPMEKFYMYRCCND